MNTSEVKALAKITVMVGGALALPYFYLKYRWEIVSGEQTVYNTFFGVTPEQYEKINKMKEDKKTL